MNPLQIGDIYMYKSEPVCVEETYANGAMIYGLECKLDIVPYYLLRAMTLNEDWLSKLGFLNQDSEWIRTFSNPYSDLITFKLLRNGFAWKSEVYCGFESPNVHYAAYVNTLQKLLRIYGDYQERGRELLYGSN